jgi:hypothetical protein
MTFRSTIFASPAAVAILSLVASCSGQGDPDVGGGGDSAVGVMSPDAGGSGGMDSGGVAVGEAGAGGIDSGSDSGSAVPATFASVKFIVMQSACFGAGCHNDDQNPLNLRLDEQLYTRLTTRISANCGNIPIVNPGKPQDSALVKILKGPCGPMARMPLGCVDDLDTACVPADYVAAITQWIANGAPPQ